MERSEIKNFCNNAIALNERMRGSYFWSSPRDAASRRRYEEQHSLGANFEYKGHTYYINLVTECSCRNIYFKQYIELDGESKDIRLLRKVLKEIKLDECKEQVTELLKEEKEILTKREYNKIFKDELNKLMGV